MPSTPTLNRALNLRVESARERSDWWFELLRPDAFYARPIPERHRLIFYLGHLEAFDWNLIGRRCFNLRSIKPEFDRLFEFGIDPPVGQTPQDQPSDWPALEEVHAYNRHIRANIDEVLADAPEQLVNVAVEHRLMHAETLAYLFHNLPYDQKFPAGHNPRRSKEPLQSSLIQIPAGVATLGQKPGEFGWDNEFDQHQVDVPAFAIGKYKVTNGEYLKFVESGAAPPHYWSRRGNQWFYRGMFAEKPLPPNAPVYVTYLEASAYAKWAGNKSLLTEPQFHRAAYGTPEGTERPYPWGAAKPQRRHGNFDFHFNDPVDVNAMPAGDSAFGVSQLVGNGWEWTSTPFGPFQGFQPFPFYPGYSKDFFDQSHYVLKGASPQTAATFLRRSFRNWFRPDYPYVYASFRVVEN